jgi:hypothetical protein
MNFGQKKPRGLTISGSGFCKGYIYMYIKMYFVDIYVDLKVAAASMISFMSCSL